MAIDRFIPTVWSAQLLVGLKNNLVFGQEGIVNKNYEGEISGFGGSVRINGIGAINVSSYSKNTDITGPDALNDNSQILVINQQKYFNFQVDDIDKAQQNPKVMGQAMIEAAYALRNQADAYIANLATQDTVMNPDVTPPAGNVSIPKLDKAGAGYVIGTDDIYVQLVNAKVALDKTNTPAEGRYIVVSPEVHGALLLDNRFIGVGSIPSDASLRNGLVGRAAGFDIYVSNNLASTALSVGTGTNCIAGHSMAISFAEQIMSVEAYRPEGRFADAVKGLYVYGAKVVRPNNLIRLIVKN